METTPGHVLKLSLKELALRRVVVDLWSDSDVLSPIGKFRLGSMTFFRSKDAFHETFEGDVKNKLFALVAPESLKKKMKSYILPIGSEIRAWLRFHEPYVTDSNGEIALPILEKLRWTSLGTLDYRKTAEEIVSNELVGLVSRYNLACVYCMEDKIPSIWEELPKEIQSKFYNKDLSHVKYPYLPHFWPYFLKGKEWKLDILTEMPGFEDSSSNQRFFYFAACQGNRAAAEYFFNKLDRFERNECLVETGKEVVLHKITELVEDPDEIPMEKHTEVLCYLLTLMTPEQQIKCIQKEPAKFFRCFLDWAWYDLYSEITKLIWNFVSAEHYETILRHMQFSFIRSDYLNPKLLQDMFVRSPVDFKKVFLHQARHFDDIFYMLFEIDILETIPVIFGNVDVEERAKLLISFKFFNIFDDLITREKWYFVKLCLREATLSAESKDTLKKTYLEFLGQDDKLPANVEGWERLFKLLDSLN